MDLKEVEWKIWTGFIWHGVGTSGWLSWARWWTFAYYNMLGISRSAGDLLPYQGRLMLSEVSLIVPKEHFLWCCINEQAMCLVTCQYHWFLLADCHETFCELLASVMWIHDADLCDWFTCCDSQ
jgi:hypothetical protein